jgi:hypothetical protein
MFWKMLFARLFVFLALLPWYHVVNAVKEPGTCEDYGIEPGPTFNSSCEIQCTPGTFEAHDYAEEDADANVLHRNHVCRCCNNEGPCQDPDTLQSEWECWTTKQVWDLSEETKTCDMYNITSQTVCQAFCLENIDPKSYGWQYNAGQVVCECAGVDICDGDEDLGIPASSNSGGVVASTSGIVAVVIGFCLFLL